MDRISLPALRVKIKLTLGPGLDSKILLAAFIIVFYGAYSQAKTKQNLRQKFSLQQLAARCNLTFFAAVNLLLTCPFFAAVKLLPTCKIDATKLLLQNCCLTVFSLQRNFLPT